jgi:hypothetical protein
VIKFVVLSFSNSNETTQLGKRKAKLSWIYIIYQWICFVCCGTGVWTQSFTLARQALYQLIHASTPFGSDSFSDKVSVSSPGQPGLWSSSDFSLLTIAGMTGVHHHTQLFSIEIKSPKLFLSWVDLERDPPKLSHLSTQDCRYEPSAPSLYKIFLKNEGATVHLLHSMFCR